LEKTGGADTRNRRKESGNTFEATNSGEGGKNLLTKKKKNTITKGSRKKTLQVGGEI